ncbi:hypothetical protein [Pilimelia columellifera]|uniref:Uncharacterized protein n=1 Tax=Pilimelia columellifera subsp. columellifera TaxID=706583 RepID=A0ABN3NFV6_9ACTN
MGNDAEHLPTAPPRSDDDRTVDLSDEGPLLPDQTADDTDHGWGEAVGHARPTGDRDDWLLAERPPHWD